MTMVLAPHRGAKTRARAAQQASGHPNGQPDSTERSPNQN
jgi:hypothetical protein